MGKWISAVSYWVNLMMDFDDEQEKIFRERTRKRVEAWESTKTRSLFKDVVQDKRAKSLEPDPWNMNVSKRQWETQFAEWREVLRELKFGEPPGLSRRKKKKVTHFKKA